APAASRLRQLQRRLGILAEEGFQKVSIKSEPFLTGLFGETSYHFCWPIEMDGHRFSLPLIRHLTLGTGFLSQPLEAYSSQSDVRSLVIHFRFCVRQFPVRRQKTSSDSMSVPNRFRAF